MKWINTKYSEPSVSISLLILRIAAGSAMAINHGLKKISNFSEMASNGFADPFHIGSKASLGLTVFAELFCAVFIILGLMTKLASIPLIIAMCVALFVAHGGDFYGKGELAGVYLVIFLLLFLIGPGKYSIDKKLGK